MSVPSVTGTLVQIVGAAAAGPLLIGWTRQVRAKLEGRQGAGVLQPYRDLRKQFGRQSIDPIGTTMVFAVAPSIMAATTLMAAALVPLVTVISPADRIGDMFAVVGLLLLGTVSLVLAGLDTGTAFGGMGASRMTTILALVEPTLLVAVFALSIPAGSTNLAGMVANAARRGDLVLSPTGALAVIALLIVVLAETGRLPFDNPTTHLELTMVHEAMILEYSGPRLAILEWSSGVRLLVLTGLCANLILPWGIERGTGSMLSLCVATAAIALKVGVLNGLVASFEVVVAKVRLFKVPELLAGSFLIGLLAVTASYFVGSQGR